MGFLEKEAHWVRRKCQEGISSAQLYPRVSITVPSEPELCMGRARLMGGHIALPTWMLGLGLLHGGSMGQFAPMPATPWREQGSES